jgi:hypothetical protein
MLLRLNLRYLVKVEAATTNATVSLARRSAIAAAYSATEATLLVNMDATLHAASSFMAKFCLTET